MILEHLSTFHEIPIRSSDEYAFFRLMLTAQLHMGGYGAVGINDRRTCQYTGVVVQVVTA